MDSETAQRTKRLSLMVTLTRTMVFTSVAAVLTNRAQTRFTIRKRRLMPKKSRYRESLEDKSRSSGSALVPTAAYLKSHGGDITYTVGAQVTAWTWL